MRVLAVDFGEKRIGIAVGESDPGAASPRAPLEPTGALDGDAGNIARLAREEQADAVVVGIPVNPDGSGRMERVCRSLCERLAALGLAVYAVDESWSSLESAERLASRGVKSRRRKRLLDGESAVTIVERFFRENETGA